MSKIFEFDFYYELSRCKEYDKIVYYISRILELDKK